MSGLDKLNQRLQYRGGNTEGRMVQDKLHSLKVAMFNSYQAETAILPDGREFKCLINPNKETGDYDNKIISMPFKDICLNERPGENGKRTHAEQETGIKCGDVITWKEQDTKWIVFLRYLEEEAYFRAQIRKCETVLNINGQDYWCYIRGPVETSIQWNQKAKVEWNDLNYSLVMYITKDENTVDFFHRHQKVKVPEDENSEVLKTWQVVDANRFYGDGIIEVYLDEDQDNPIADAAAAEYEANKPPVIEIPVDQARIEGPTEPTMYEYATYSIVNAEGGSWYIRKGDTEKLLLENEDTLSISIGRTKEFTIIYRTEDEDIELDVKVQSL